MFLACKFLKELWFDLGDFFNKNFSGLGSSHTIFKRQQLTAIKKWGGGGVGVN